MNAANKRREKDIMKLMVSDFEVVMAETPSSSFASEFYVKFQGPKESPYEEGVWKVRVGLPEQYPYKSPSIGFMNRIFHPNIDEASGSVCLDVINQTWSPMFDLINIFDIFLPQLLLYPNPADPLNAEAAALNMKNQEKFKERVKDHIKKYATLESYEKLAKQGTKTIPPTSAPGGMTNGKSIKPTAHPTKGKHNAEDDGDGSELSQTSDIEPMIEDDEDMAEEQKENA